MTRKKHKRVRLSSRAKTFLDSSYTQRVAAVLFTLEAPFSSTQAFDAAVRLSGLSDEQVSETLEEMVNLGLIRACESEAGFELVPEAYSHFFRATVSYSKAGTIYLTPEDGSPKVSSSVDVGALPGDVVVACHDWRRNIVMLLSRASNRWVCRWHHERFWEPVFVPLGCEFVRISMSREMLESQESYEGKLVEIELDQESMQPACGGFFLTAAKVLRILGEEDSSQGEIHAAAVRFGLPYEFSKAALEEAQALPDEIDAKSELSSRVDLRDIAFVTIDGEDAKDFDDAVWCCRQGDDQWRLLVAIADVSRYVEAGGALDADAQARATSTYFPGFVIPMLPEKLSNGLCSLNPGVDRCTMVCDMVVNKEGLVTAYQFYPALIHSHARLTYTCVYAALQGDDSELVARGGALADISELHALYKAFAAARKQRGAIGFESVETKIILNADGTVAAVDKREHNDAHALIEECMLAANTCAADFVLRHKALCLMRVHDKPSPEKLCSVRNVLRGYRLKLGGGDAPTSKDYEAVLSRIADKPYRDAVQEALLRSMSQASYSVENIGHYGLCYEAYTHFTSPIRRYPDLLVHRTIRALLGKRKYLPRILIDETEMRESAAGRRVIAAQLAHDKNAGVEGPKKGTALDRWRRLGVICSAAERRAEEASRDIEAWFKAMYLSKYVGKNFQAVVTGVVEAGLFVRLTKLYVEGFVHISRLGDDYYTYDETRACLIGSSTRECFRVGTLMDVRVQSVDPKMRTIDFVCCNPGRRLGKRRSLPELDFLDEDFDDF